MSNMTRNRATVLLLECTTIQEDMFEGRMLKEYFKILESLIPVKGRARYVKIRSRKHFLNVVARAKEKYIHISAHGKYNKRTNVTRLVLPYGDLDSGDIEGELASKLRNKVLFVNACEVAHHDMANAFLRCGCSYFIGPLRGVKWVDAAVFSILFYKALLVDKRDVLKSRNYAERLRNIKGRYNVWIPPPPP